MPASRDTPIPGDIIREGLTNEQLETLKELLTADAHDKGLTASFQQAAQPDGLMTLFVHFARQSEAPAPPPPGQRTGPSARGGNDPPPPHRAATPGQDQKVERFRPMLELIAEHEGTARQPGGGYNTSLGFGVFIPGGEKTLVEMTLLQIDALQTQILNNPKNKLNSSAIGRYQIVQKTLRSLKIQLKLSQIALFDKDLQDQLGVALISECGRDVRRLRGEWTSLKSVDSSLILDTFDADGSAQA